MVVLNWRAKVMCMEFICEGKYMINFNVIQCNHLVYASHSKGLILRAHKIIAHLRFYSSS